MFRCASCLAHEAGISTAEGRGVVWRLQALPGFEMRGTRCVACLRGKRTIRYVGRESVIGAPSQVILFLLTNKDIYLCASCIGFAAEISLADVRGVIEYIGCLPEFECREGQCTVCVRHTTVIAARSTDEDYAPDLPEPVNRNETVGS